MPSADRLAAEMDRLRARRAGLQHELAEVNRALALGGGQPEDALARLQQEVAQLRAELAARNGRADYEARFNAAFHTSLATPNTWPFTTFEQGTPWCTKVVEGMEQGEFLYAAHLIEGLDAAGIAGDILEFGTYFGTWIETLTRICEARGNGRRLWGFDSFEGLPRPDAVKDGGIWHEGQYSAPFETVAAQLRLAERPHLRLVKGWFSDTLPQEPAQSIERIAYARIDGDLYSSARDCLAYLASRLVDQAILVFDDWQFTWEIGEPLAFAEWSAANPQFRFEFLAMNMWAHLYCRVHRSG
jgi:hypothetical protein